MHWWLYFCDLCEINICTGGYAIVICVRSKHVLVVMLLLLSRSVLLVRLL